MKKLFNLFLLILCLASCKKLETEPPVVTLLSPTTTDTLYVNDSVKINFTITDKNLKSYKIIIYNFYSRKLFYNEEGITDGNEITIDKKVFFDINADTTAYVNILGLDKNGNTGGVGTAFYIRK